MLTRQGYSYRSAHEGCGDYGHGAKGCWLRDGSVGGARKGGSKGERTWRGKFSGAMFLDHGRVGRKEHRRAGDEVSS